MHTVNPDQGEVTNTVISSDPAAGSPVQPGSSVDLYVSNGYVKVPNLFGLTPDQAAAKLAQAGFTNPPTTHLKPSKAGPAGTVVSQDIQPSEWKAPDTVVTIAVAKAKPTPTPTTAPPTTNPPSSSPPSSSPPSSNSPSSTDSPIIPVGPASRGHGHGHDGLPARP